MIARIAILALLCTGCTERPAPHAAAPPAPMAPAEYPAPQVDPPPPVTPEPEAPTASTDTGVSRPEPGLVEIPVPDFNPALVSIPDSSRPRQPLLMAVHGAGDGPEWECRTWRSYVGPRGVIACPTGRSLGGDYGGFYHPDHFALERLVLASLKAVRQQLGEYLDDGPVVYAAYSQGATMGSLMIVPHGGTFSRLILVEGGHSEWNVPRGVDYKKTGGERVLFACGTPHCRRAAERSRAWLEQAGLEARLETDLRSGHSYGGPLGERLAELFNWVVGGDPRWGP